MNPLAPPEVVARRGEAKERAADTPGAQPTLVSDSLSVDLDCTRVVAAIHLQHAADGNPLAMPSFDGNEDDEVSSSADPPLAVDSGEVSLVESTYVADMNVKLDEDTAHRDFIESISSPTGGPQTSGASSQ